MKYSIDDRVVNNQPLEYTSFTIPTGTPGTVMDVLEQSKSYRVLFDGLQSSVRVLEDLLDPLEAMRGLDVMTAVPAPPSDSRSKKQKREQSPTAAPATAPAAPPKSDNVRNIVGIAVIVVFLAIIGTLFFKLDMEETPWTRAIYLLSGIEAIAFAAAGYFFGRDVGRQNTQLAQEREAQATEKAEQKQKEAETASKELNSVKAEIRGMLQAAEPGVPAGEAERGGAGARGVRGGMPAGVMNRLDELSRE